MTAPTTPRTIRDDVMGSVGDLLGTYTLVGGSQIPAICVIPDAVRGYDFPEYGTEIKGIEAVIEKPYGEAEKALIGKGLNTRYDWVVCLKQWDANASLYEASQILLNSLACKYLIVKAIQIPQSNRLSSIEQYKITIREWCVNGATRPCVSSSVSYLGLGFGI